MTDNTLNIIERWLPIPEWEGVYSVSNTGQIRRDKDRDWRTKSGKILAQSITTRGYCLVALHDAPRKIKQALVHSFVTRAFIGECPPGKQINHIDFNKRNNHVENLEYVTPKENVFHSRHNRCLRQQRRWKREV